MQRVKVLPAPCNHREEDRMKVRKKEMNPDVLIRDGKAGLEERTRGRKKKTGRGRVAVGSGVRSRFLEPFNDIPEENE